MSTVSVHGSRRPSSAPSPQDGWELFASGIRGDGTEARRAWRSRYVGRALALDAAVALLASLLGYWLWFEVIAADGPRPPVWEALFLPVAWIPAMLLARAYEQRFLWIGVEEYRRV